MAKLEQERKSQTRQRTAEKNQSKSTPQMVHLARFKRQNTCAQRIAGVLPVWITILGRIEWSHAEAKQQSSNNVSNLLNHPSRNHGQRRHHQQGNNLLRWRS